MPMPDGGEELEHVDRRRRGAGDEAVGLVEAEALAASTAPARRRVLLGERVVDRSPPARRDRRGPRRAPSRRPPLLVGLGPMAASSAAFIFSQTRGTAPNVVGRTSGTISDHPRAGRRSRSPRAP